jgi:hypothetical protein
MSFIWEYGLYFLFFFFFWGGRHQSTHCFNIRTLLCPFFLFFSCFWHGFFSIAHTSLFGIWKLEGERLMINEWSFILVDGKSCLCVTLIGILFVGVCESWSWVHDDNLNKSHNNLTKLNVNTSSIWLRFCIMEYLSYGLGRNYNHLRSMLIKILIL